MIERAEEQGGSVTRSAGVPSGTVVTASLPLGQPSATLRQPSATLRQPVESVR